MPGKIKKSAAKKKAAKKSAKKTPAKAKAKTASKTGLIGKPKVTVGQTVPAFTLPSTGGKEISLKDLAGRTVVLYFYPKDSTPGCTIEGRDFTRLHGAFVAAAAEVFGISRDSIKSHERFKTNEKYSVDLLSDEDEKVVRIFGVMKLKNMYGKQVRGIERSTFVIDKDGKLLKEWRGVSVPGHAEEVLNYIKSLT
jgi:peroxiredoxin Q/BCP